MDLKTKNYINSLKYLPKALQENVYYRKICSLIDCLLSENSEYFRSELSALGAAINKYRDFRNLDYLTTHQVVKEFGFQYIVDILELPDSQLKDLVAFISLINMMKGTKMGLELVLSLLRLDYHIIEWFEDRELLPYKNTYALNLTLTDLGVSKSFMDNFYRFSREYVYPLLTNLTLHLRYTYGRIYTGVAISYHPNVKIYPGETDTE